jgi:hypothetical protein
MTTVTPTIVIEGLHKSYGKVHALDGLDLVAGFLVMAGLFGAGATGIGLATDLQGGLVDRFRSLPMAKSAVLTAAPLPTSCAASVSSSSYWRLVC